MTNAPTPHLALILPTTPDAGTRREPPVSGTATQPMPPAVARCRQLLTAVLESGPTLEDTFTLNEALDLLLDVVPPFPPLGLELDPLEPDVGVPAALTALDEAASDARSVREVTRYTMVALTLQGIRPAVVPDERPTPTAQLAHDVDGGRR